MRIGIDGRELMGRPTGVGRYLRELLREWSAAPHGHRFILYVPAAAAGELDPGVTNDGSPIDVRAVNGAAGTWWEQIALRRALKRDDLDVFFAPAYSAPLVARPPVVLTLHDVSFAAHPEWFRPREGLRRRTMARWSGRRAALVLTDSMFSRGQITALLGVPDGRVQVIPIGVRLPGRRSTKEREPMVLFVGSLLNRRRIPDLIAAFEGVARQLPDAHLVLVGENRTYPRQDPEAVVREHGLAGRVSIRSYVDEAELQDLYDRAGVFAFLSEYEGFGLTPLEALASGVPVVTLDTPVAREIYGDAAVFVRPDDTAGIAVALTSLLTDTSRRAAILDRAPAVLGRYSWQRAAAATLAALETAAAEPRTPNLEPRTSNHEPGTQHPEP
jgi:glycosyltransferase involved in cell wall biosynthesis